MRGSQEKNLKQAKCGKNYIIECPPKFINFLLKKLKIKLLNLCLMHVENKNIINCLIFSQNKQNF